MVCIVLKFFCPNLFVTPLFTGILSNAQRPQLSTSHIPLVYDMGGESWAKGPNTAAQISLVQSTAHCVVSWVGGGQSARMRTESGKAWKQTNGGNVLPNGCYKLNMLTN